MSAVKGADGGREEMIEMARSEKRGGQESQLRTGIGRWKNYVRKKVPLIRPSSITERSYVIHLTVDHVRCVQGRGRDGVLERGHLLASQLPDVPQHAPVVIQVAAAVRARKEINR